MEPFHYKVYSGLKNMYLTLLIGGDIFILFGLIMILTCSSDLIGSCVDLIGPILFAIVWNAFFIYFIPNCPKHIVLSEEDLTVTWWYKGRTVKYPWHDVRLEKIGLNPRRVIKVKDANIKRHRLLSLNGWDVRYDNLIDRIEHYIN